jgi:predicted  nucleic acid-binding Zn-ribbon protein
MQPEDAASDINDIEKSIDFNSKIEGMKAKMKETNPELFRACQDCGKSIFHFHQRCDVCDRTRWAVMSLDSRMGSLNQDRERLDELQKQIANLSPELKAKISESSPK